MKKLTALLVGILFVSFTSCDSIEDAISVSGTKTITNDFDVSIPQTTAGTPQSLNESTTINMSEVVSDATSANVESVKVNSLSYTFKNHTGNTAGRIVTMSLKIGNEEFAAVSDVDPSVGASFTITDAAKLTAIENILKNATTTLSATGTIQSDAGDMSFDVEVAINVTVTLKP
ncbi:MAG: hypothetical protein ACPGUU_09695 [Flavobacteriaceae bacterium]